MQDSLFDVLRSHPANNVQAIDFSHAMLVAGLVTAHKPATVLELGVGSAFLTRVLLAALEENRRGTLTSVDNFSDWGKQEPEHIVGLRQRAPNWRLEISDEAAFLQRAAANSFDFVVSDGDHTHGYQNASDIFRLCAPGGLLVFHDTNSDMFRLLRRLPGRCRRLGFSSVHFTARSRAGERTERGLLVVAKDRRRRFTMDPVARAYLFWRDRVVPALRRVTRKHRM